MSLKMSMLLTMRRKGKSFYMSLKYLRKYECEYKYEYEYEYARV